MTRGAFASFVLCAAAAVAAAQDSAKSASGDSVTWIVDGMRRTRTGVTVESAGYDQVAISQAGRRTTLSGASVVEIRFGDAPPEYDEALVALHAGDAETARADFDAALKRRETSSSPRGWLVEYGAAGLGEALLALAAKDPKRWEAAAHAFATAREANPKSLLTERILGGIARAELGRGRADAALAAADDLVAAGRAAKRPAWEIAGTLLRGRALEARGDFAGAVRADDEAASLAEAQLGATKDVETSRTLRDCAVEAAVRKTWLLVGEAERTKSTDSAQRAQAAAVALTTKWPDAPPAAAAAGNAAGALLLASGDARRALRRFAEVEVLHFDVRDEAAHALWYEAACFERLGDDAKRLERIADLTENYPETEWARRARR